MKTFLKLSCVMLFAALFACNSNKNPDQSSAKMLVSGPKKVVSVADFALGYLIEVDTGQSDTTLHANMDRMRALDQQLRNTGTGNGTTYQIMSSCVCTCTPRCCLCSSGPLLMAAPSSVNSVRISTGDTIRVSSSPELTDSIKIFSLDLSTYRGNADLIIEYDNGIFRMPVEITSDTTLTTRIP